MVERLNAILHTNLVLSNDGSIPVETGTDVISSEDIPANEQCGNESAPPIDVNKQADSSVPGQTESLESSAASTAIWTGWVRKPFIWILLVCFVSLDVFLIVRNRSHAEYVSDDGTHYTAEYLSKSVPDEPDNPFLHLTPSLEIIPGDGMNFWMYTVKAVEMNNLPITIDRVEEITLTKKGGNRRIFSKGDLIAIGKEPEIPANGSFTFTGGLPVQNVVIGIGIVINAQGREFRTWIPMNQ